MVRGGWRQTARGGSARRGNEGVSTAYAKPAVEGRTVGDQRSRNCASTHQEWRDAWGSFQRFVQRSAPIVYRLAMAFPPYQHCQYCIIRKSLLQTSIAHEKAILKFEIEGDGTALISTTDSLGQLFSAPRGGLVTPFLRGSTKEPRNGGFGSCILATHNKRSCMQRFIEGLLPRRFLSSERGCLPLITNSAGRAFLESSRHKTDLLW